MDNKKEIERRIDSLIDQINDIEDQIFNDVTQYSAAYFLGMEKIGKMRDEKKALENIFEKNFNPIDRSGFDIPTEIPDIGKIKRMKQTETEEKMRFVMSMTGDKVNIRRAMDKFLNYRTDMIKRFIKDVYGADVNLDSLMLNIKTGQYGL